MIPRLQIRREENSRSDCLAACLASLLELEMKEVPDFALMTENDPTDGRYPTFWLELQSFVKKFGYFFLEVRLTQHTPWMPIPFDALCILIGYTESNHRHAIIGVCRDGDFIAVHDPSGKNVKLQVESVCFLVPLDNSKMMLVEPSNIILPPSHDTDSRS